MINNKSCPSGYKMDRKGVCVEDNLSKKIPIKRRPPKIKKPTTNQNGRDIPDCCSGAYGSSSPEGDYGTFDCDHNGNISDNCTPCGRVPTAAYSQCSVGNGTWGNVGTYTCDQVSIANGGMTWNDVCCECNNAQDCYDLYGDAYLESEYECWRCSSTTGGIGYGNCGGCYTVPCGVQPITGGQDVPDVQPKDWRHGGNIRKTRSRNKLNRHLQPNRQQTSMNQPNDKALNIEGAANYWGGREEGPCQEYDPYEEHMAHCHCLVDWWNTYNQDVEGIYCCSFNCSDGSNCLNYGCTMECFPNGFPSETCHVHYEPGGWSNTCGGCDYLRVHCESRLPDWIIDFCQGVGTPRDAAEGPPKQWRQGGRIKKPRRK